MPVNLVLTDILQAQIFCQVAEQTSIMGIHYFVSVLGASPATDQDACDFISTEVAPDVRALIENNALYQGVQIRIINRTPPPVPVQSADGSGVGSAGAVGLPRQTCGLISWKTGFSGPARRGRMYVAFPAAADNIAGGSASGGYITRVGDLVTTLLGPMLVSVSGRTATLRPVIFSRKLNDSFAITQGITSNKWATQRRRGSFGRANTGPFG